MAELAELAFEAPDESGNGPKVRLETATDRAHHHFLLVEPSTFQPGLALLVVADV